MRRRFLPNTRPRVLLGRWNVARDCLRVDNLSLPSPIFSVRRASLGRFERSKGSLYIPRASSKGALRTLLFYKKETHALSRVLSSLRLPKLCHEREEKLVGKTLMCTSAYARRPCTRYVFRQRPRGNANLGSRMPNERASLLRDNGLYAACRVHAAKGRDRYRKRRAEWTRKRDGSRSGSELIAGREREREGRLEEHRAVALRH